MKVWEGNYQAEHLKVAAVVSRFNEFLTSKLLGGAQDCFLRHGGKEDDFSTFWVPGSFEIPLLSKKLASLKKYDFIVCLGAVIRGATPHFEFVASEAAKGVAMVSLEAEIPIMFGVLTTDTLEQAIERAGTKARNKGWEAALGGIEMANLLRRIE